MHSSTGISSRERSLCLRAPYLLVSQRKRCKPNYEIRDILPALSFPLLEALLCCQRSSFKL